MLLRRLTQCCGKLPPSTVLHVLKWRGPPSLGTPCPALRCSLHQSSLHEKKTKNYQQQYPKDNVDTSKNTLIYVNHMSHYFHRGYIIISATVAATGGVIACATYQLWDTLPASLLDANMPFVQMMIMGSFGIGLWTSMLMMMKSAILRIYHNNDTNIYTAIGQDGKLKYYKMSFKATDIRWKKPGFRGNYYIFNFPVHLNEKDFRSSIHFKALCKNAFKNRPPEDEEYY